jgi:superfamily II DNA/RNA helicase
MTTQILASLGFESLNAMQEAMLEAYPKQGDLILLSPTGSGKTVAFLLPLVKTVKPQGGMQAVVVVPSRELALQIERVFKSMKTGLRAVCCYGGHDARAERNALAESPELIIATPGRLLDHMRAGDVATDGITTLVLDEFDKSLELGFTDEMAAIIAALPSLTKRVLTSATDGTELPPYLALQAPRTLSFLGESAVNDRLALYRVQSPVADKLDTLYALICETGAGQKLVFANYRESAARISADLTRRGIDNVLFHGGMEQADREKALARYRNGSVNILVSTDLAARGLDIPEIRHIIHYHLPVNREAFVHRNGRTARVDRTGSAYLILGPDEYVPDYVDQPPLHFALSPETPEPAKPEWVTIYIGKGKKDKLSKGDIAGFLMKTGGLERGDVGIIEVRDHQSYAAVRADKAQRLLKRIEGQKIKNIKTRFAVAK